MGVSERDYIRNRPTQRGGYGGSGGGPLSAMSMWSVNTWIIAICVGVFVINPFLPLRDVVMHVQPTIAEEEWSALDKSLLKVDNNRTATKIDRLTGKMEEGFQIVFLETPQGNIEVAKQHFQVMYLLQSLGHFSTERGFLKFQFWRLIGFQFLHGNFPHILFNMIGLFFFGSMIERYLGSKRYLAFYLLCGIFGALMYCLLNLGGVIASTFLNSDIQIPGLLFNHASTPLIGASAGVFGILMAGAYLAPNVKVLLFFILPMRLKTLAYALVAIALFTVITNGNNAGGEAGHLGGAFAGFYFIRHTQHLHGFFDFLGRIDPTSHHYRNKVRGLRPGRRNKSHKEIDRILDKISAKGLHSLTEKEKKILSQASQND